MATLRIFARSVISTSKQIYNNYQPCQYVIASNIQVNKRYASFKTSPIYNEERKYVDYEMSKDPVEWSYVERLLVPKHIPLPPENVEKSASGWKSPKDESKKLPYFINRTKNHQLPVYLHRKNRNLRRITALRKIDGDMIALEADLKKYLEKATKIRIGSQILEPSGIIKFRGDYVNLIKKWLENHGF